MASQHQLFYEAGHRFSKFNILNKLTFLSHYFRVTLRIEEFQRKLEAVRLEANLEKLVTQECVKVQNKLGLNLYFYEKFTKLWDGLEIRDK